MVEIIVAGTPESGVLLEQISAKLSELGESVTSYYGASLDAIDPAAWEKAEILLCYGLSCGLAEMRRARNLRAVVSPTIGYEWIDEEAASNLGILVVNGAVPENHESMAEATILLILAALYDLPGAQAELRGESKARVSPRMLKGKTVGLIGYGNIAQGVVARLQCWGVTFLAHRRTRQHADDSVHVVPLESLLENSDVVVVLASLNEESKHMIDANALDRMKPGAVLINVSRGGLVDENALTQKLADNRLSMIALDVFETEPLPDTSPLRQFPNAILTPHALGHTQECYAAIPRAAVEIVLMLGRGETPPSTRNSQIVSAWSRRFG